MKSRPFEMKLQLFAEPGVNFEEILGKYAGEGGAIPAESVGKAASAISSAVGRAFVDKKRYNDKLDEIETLKADKQAAEDKLTAAERWQDKYAKEHEAFEKFKADADAKEKLGNLKAAYKKLLGDSGIDPRRHEAIVRATSFENMKLGEDGRLEGEEGLKKAIETDWADFKVTTVTKGADVATPPGNHGPAKKSREEIMAIKDAGERQKAIAQNHELFGF